MKVTTQALEDAVADALTVKNITQDMVAEIVTMAHADAVEDIDRSDADWPDIWVDGAPFSAYRQDIRRALRRVYRAAFGGAYAD